MKRKTFVLSLSKGGPRYGATHIGRPFNALLASPLVIGLVFILAACGGANEPGPAPTVVPTPAPAATPTPQVTASLLNKGKQLADTKACLGCHSIDGRVMTGPSWKGLFGKTEQIQGGDPVVVDDVYLRESITDPKAKIVDGFFDLMPVVALQPDEVDALVAYIKTVE